MRIDIRELKSSVGEHRTESFSEPVGTLSLGSDEVRFPEPAQVKAELFNTGDGILADIDVRAEAELSCSRCLKPFRLPLKVHFREEFRPEPAIAAADTSKPQSSRRQKARTEEEPDEEERGEIYATYSGDEIDLSQSVEETLFLNLPMKPLCRPDCRGLCPHCGHDLNEGPCNCEEPVTDPRLAGLRELWEQRNSKH